jgi:hypothetical protein
VIAPNGIWWAAFVVGSGVFSIVNRPEKDPFSGSVDDPWTGLGRPFAILILMTIWKLALYLRDIHDTIIFCGLAIDTTLVLPYVFDFCMWGTYLLPIAIFVGYVGHPITVFVAIIEACNRYMFGQSGVAGLSHMLMQLCRGFLSAFVVWGLLNQQTRFAVPGAIAVSTFLGVLPVPWKCKCSRSWWKGWVWSLVCGAIAFGISFLFQSVVPNDKWQTVDIVGIGWLLFVDVVFPVVSTYNRYGLFHLRIIPLRSPWLVAIRGLSPIVIAPFMITSGLRDNLLPKWLSALVIVHAIQKAHTEPHIFALAMVIAIFTFPFDLGRRDATSNFCLSLLIVSKWEVVLPLIRFLTRSRWMFDLLDSSTILDSITSIFEYVLFGFIDMVPSIDWTIKIPSLVWASITGSTLLFIQGRTMLVFPGSLRPFYFFDWPRNGPSDYHRIFASARIEHPVEAPTYTSASIALVRQFIALARSGGLGLITCGDFYIFTSDPMLIFVHIIAIEPSGFCIQVRGAEYRYQTVCHSGEAHMLDVAAVDLNPLGRAVFSRSSAWELRQDDVELIMHGITETSLNRSFIGISNDRFGDIFMLAFCRAAVKSNFDLEAIRDESARRNPEIQRKMNQLFEIMRWPRTEQEVMWMASIGMLSRRCFFRAHCSLICLKRSEGTSPLENRLMFANFWFRR